MKEKRLLSFLFCIILLFEFSSALSSCGASDEIAWVEVDGKTYKSLYLYQIEGIYDTSDNLLSVDNTILSEYKYYAASSVIIEMNNNVVLGADRELKTGEMFYISSLFMKPMLDTSEMDFQHYKVKVSKTIKTYPVSVKKNGDSYIITYYSSPEYLCKSKDDAIGYIDEKRFEVSADRVTIMYK